MVTLRPPPGAMLDPDLRETLRAPAMAGLAVERVKRRDEPTLELEYEPAPQEAAPHAAMLVEIEDPSAGIPTPLCPPAPKVWAQTAPSVDLMKLLDLDDEDFDLDDLAPPPSDG